MSRLATMALVAWAIIIAAITAALLVSLTSRARAQSSWTGEFYPLVIAGPGGCWVYASRVDKLPIINWKCAENAIASRDAMIAEYARALIAVRDGKYEEAK